MPNISPELEEIYSKRVDKLKKKTAISKKLVITALRTWICTVL